MATRRPATGWRTMWVQVPEPGASRVQTLTFLRAFLLRWTIIMVVAAILLASTGESWAALIGAAVVGLSLVNLASAHVRLVRERARSGGG